MGLRTVEQFLSGLRDGREVYYRGQRVPDVTEHPELGVAARHAAIDFQLAEDPKLQQLATRREGNAVYSTYYHIPRCTQDLLDRSKLIETGTALGGTLVLLIKEIGTDALFALMRLLARAGETQGLERVRTLYRRSRDGDLALAVAQTDAKGDRSKRPSEQLDPDLNVRVVEKRSDGIVVRGAKAHTSCSPISTKHKMIETLTVFDDVFVPWERVFFHDRPDLAGSAALGFVEYHRFTAVSYKLPLLDALVGSAISIAQANGIERAGHVRDKLTWLAGYAETVRALVELAALRCEIVDGFACPHVFTTNLAKWTFARDFHRAIEIVQDLAGGLLVTGPSGADWNSSEVRSVLEKYLRGAWPAERRLAMLYLISELTTRLYGGYQAVLAVHAEGSLEAEKMAMLRSYDAKRAQVLAMRLAGLASDEN